jgi:hypothetical protein
VIDDATQVSMFKFKLRAKGGEFHRARGDREGHPVLLRSSAKDEVDPLH